MTLRRVYDRFATAVQFLTRVPLPGGMNVDSPDRSLLREAVPCFPVVGSLIGGFSACVLVTASQVWPVPVAVILALMAEALLTGAFHEDAVADACDAFGGGWTREDVLRILKDSRVGSFGALGLTLAVALRGGCLMLHPSPAWLVASATLGRWAILPMMWLVPPVPHREGVSKDVGERVTAGAVIFATVAAIPGVMWVDPWRLGVAVAGVVVVTAVWGRAVYRRLGGVTGDCLGAGCYAAQCVTLLVACAAR